MKKAAEDIVLILVDCSKPGGDNGLGGKYGVSALPTVVFLDPEAKVVGKLADRSPSGVAQQFRDLVQKHAKLVPWEEDIEKALAAGKKDDKPVLAFFPEDDRDSKQAEAVFQDESLKETLAKFVLFRHEVHEKDCELCDGYRVRKGPTILILDPADEEPGKRPISKVTTAKKKAKSLLSTLKSALRRFERSREKKQD